MSVSRQQQLRVHDMEAIAHAAAQLEPSEWRAMRANHRRAVEDIIDQMREGEQFTETVENALRYHGLAAHICGRIAAILESLL